MAMAGWIGRLWLAAMVVSLSATMVAHPALGAPTVKGDPVVWAEIVAALKKARGTTFRWKYTSGGVTTIMEFVPPDSMHMINQSPAGVSETLSVGTAYRVRNGDKWACPPEVAMGAGVVQSIWIWDLPGEVVVTRGQNLVIDNMPTRGYAYTYSQQSFGLSTVVNYKLYVGVQTGLPRRSVMSQAGYTWTGNFYDYGAKITITLPPCS